VPQHDYQPRPLAELPPPQFAAYAANIKAQNAAFYVGAGISRDSGLPLSSQLVARMEPGLKGELGINPYRTNDDGEQVLRAVEDIADEAEAIGHQALRSVQAIALNAAPFRTAQPSYAHLALAFLLWEGVVPVFSANWDECVEKAATQLGFDLPTTVTEADRIARFKDAAFHKVHGCASDFNSLLISTNQIGEPPAWAESEVQAALSGKTVIFLGLGTVAGYVETRIKHVFEVVPAASLTYVVVTPGEPSESWQSLLPDGAAQSHEDATASVFVDHLLRAIWNRITTMVAQRASDMVDAHAWENDEIRKGIEKVREAFKETDALSALVWMRHGCGGVMVGTPAVLGDAGEALLLGLAAATDSRSLEVLGRDDAFTVEVEGRYIELAYWPGRPSGYVVTAEEARVDRRARDGHYRDLGKPVLHLCLDPDGPLPATQAVGHLIDEEAKGDLIDPGMEHQWLSVRRILEGGRTPALV
jgi:hypothetical protein